MIEDEYGVGQIRLDRTDIRRRHVDGHRFDLGPAALQAFPEGFQGFDALAVSHEHHRPRVQVQDHRQVTLPPADGDFIDGDLPQVVELDPAEFAAEIPLLDVLDEVPTHLQMPATSRMVIWRDNSRTYRSKAWV